MSEKGLDGEMPNADRHRDQDQEQDLGRQGDSDCNGSAGGEPADEFHIPNRLPDDFSKNEEPAAEDASDLSAADLGSIDAELKEMMDGGAFDNAVQADLEADMRALEHMDKHRASACNVALVVTNLLEPLPLETMMAADKVAGEVVETDTGCVVWRKIEITEDDEFNALLGEERPVPADAEELAIKVSQITPYGAVLFVSTLSNDTDADPGVHGQIVGRVYYDGKFDRTIPPGPMIACSDGRLEDLLLGRTTPTDYPREENGTMRLRDMPAQFLKHARAMIMAEREARRRRMKRCDKRDQRSEDA